jgi:tetratricopeptide (TPR) repeat protein
MPDPSPADFQYHIGLAMSRGDWAGAAAAAAGCRAAWPAEPAGWLLGSIVALLADDKSTALSLVDSRLAADPDDVQCLLQRAECLLSLGDRAESLRAVDGVLSRQNAGLDSLDAVGEFLVHAGEHARALSVYSRVLAEHPGNASMLGKRAVLHRYLGAFELAAADYAALLRLSPQDSEALKGLAELRRQSTEGNSIAAMQTALAAVPSDSKEASTLHFGLAKSYEDMTDYAASWRHLHAGNALERARIHYNPATDRAVIERIITGFPAIEDPAPDTTGERPIFIIGLPRTGTTLVERIIGSHSAVHAAGELPALSEAVGCVVDMGSPTPARTWLEYAAALGRLDGAAIASEYLQRARARRGERARFSDKQPTNFYYCALILRAFPNAAIVHLTRHPLAACHAIYKTRFGGTYPFAYELGELGEFYLGYRRLMAHWQRILPGRILDVAYEDIISHQEATTRRMLEYCGLAFETACLDFHLNAAPSATASSVQVRQPLYDSSVHLWRHYATQLAPLRARLEAAGIAVDDE